MFTFDRADRRARNMSEMMDRLGLDTDAFAQRRLGLDLSSAIRTCQFCNADEVCRDWLARSAKSLAKAPAFCPNATLFAQTRREPTRLPAQRALARKASRWDRRPVPWPTISRTAQANRGIPRPRCRTGRCGSR